MDIGNNVNNTTTTSVATKETASEEQNEMDATKDGQNIPATDI